ncbi:hypothetical protein V6N12_065385 [Hibiscus sabdariffa]|uniref:Uncharacterized protein n=1 Tax=Hibiscus sabdariffa TaxID=183260 RepID=A0ABR2G8J4_9ROSI
MGVGSARNKTWSSKLLGSRSGLDWTGPQWGWAHVESLATANRVGSAWTESVLPGSFELLSRSALSTVGWVYALIVGIRYPPLRSPKIIRAEYGDKNASSNGLNPLGGRRRRPPSRGLEPSVIYHSGRARIITLCQDLRAKGQSQVDNFYGT